MNKYYAYIQQYSKLPPPPPPHPWEKKKKKEKKERKKSTHTPRTTTKTTKQLNNLFPLSLKADTQLSKYYKKADAEEF